MFSTFALTGNILTPAIAFTSLSLIENVSWAATLVPEFITETMEVSDFKTTRFLTSQKTIE